MEIHQVRYFLAVARTGNFSRAARECHVSQPSLSQQIKKLEEELGGPLFHRQPQGAVLTEAGHLFFTHAARIAAEVEEAQRRVQESGGTVRGRLVLGALPTIAPYLLPRLLEPFAREYPEVEVIVHEEITPRLLEGVHSGDIDLALLSLPVAGAGLERVELFEEPLLLVVPKAHSLARKRRVVMADLPQEKFILMQEGHCLSDQALEFCHTRGDFSPSVSCRSAQVQTLLALVETGLGLSIVPEMAATPRKGLLYREISPVAPKRRVGFVWRSNRFQPLAAGRLVERAMEMTQLLRGRG